MVKSGLVLACVALAQWVSAQQAPQMEALPIDPNVRYGVLDNGLTYYVRHNETPKNRAEFHIAQKVGSILENEDQRGLAHFLEHMAFNGTEHFPGKNMLNYLENKGIKFGVDINAYTGFDETVYRISNVPTQNQNLVDSCLLVLYDWACAISLNDKDIDEERGVIHEEWRTRADANWRTWEVTVPVMFAGSQYANRMPIGTMEVVMNFPYQALRDYYHKWYRPDQQGIIVIGDFDADKMEAQIKELFGKIKMPENAAERIYYTVLDNKEPIFAFHKDKEATYTRVDIYMKHDPMPREMRGTINGAINDYMGQVVGIMFNDRISEITQKPDAPFIAGAIFDGDFFVSKTKDAFTLIALGKDNRAIDAIKGIMREAERIDRFGFTASEYDRARATLLSRYENMYKERNNHKNIDYAEEYIRHFIDGGYIPGIEMEYNLLKQISPAITVDMVNQYIKTLISEDNMVISLTGPDKEGVSYPDKDQVLAAIKEVEAEEITPYVDNVSNEPLISDEPVAGKIVKSAAGKKFGTTEWTLSNGVKVILKPTDFKSDEISMQAVSKGGLSLYDYTDRALVKNLKAVNEIVELSGLGKYGRTDLMKALAGKTVSTYFSLGEPMEMINASCATKDLETMMQLVYLTFTDIHRDEDAFAAWKEQMKAVLTNYANDPQFIFSDSLSATLYNHNIMREPLKAEDIDLINYDRILEIAKERTANAADYTFIFVGNFDIDSLKPVVEKYIASLPANKNRDKVGKISTIQPGLIDNNFTLPMQTAKSTVYAIYSGKQKYDLRSNIMFSMLDQIMDIVYTETIREEEGGTYGVGTSSNLSPVNNSWLFLFGFDTNPQDEKRLTDRAHAELNKVVTEGPREKDFNKVKEYMLKQHAQNLRENSYWTNIIKSDVLGYGDNNTDYENIINSITLDDMKKFTKKLFNGKNIIEVTMTGVVEDETK